MRISLLVPRCRLLGALGLAAAVAGGCAGTAVAVTGGLQSGTTAVIDTSYGKTVTHVVTGAAPGVTGANTTAALTEQAPQVLGSDAPVPVSPALLTATNGWTETISSGLVAVYAGSVPGDSTTGRLVIVRQSSGAQLISTVDVPNSGAVTITGPNGYAAASADVQQVHATTAKSVVTYSTANGGSGNLSLTTDKVSTARS